MRPPSYIRRRRRRKFFVGAHALASAAPAASFKSVYRKLEDSRQSVTLSRNARLPVERSIHCFWFISRSRTTAVSSLWLLFAQRQMLVNGAINVLPSLVNEYSTAMDFDLVTRLAINPVDSRLRRVLVSIRCETLPRRRRSSPCRWGRSLSEDKILAVHLPMKIIETIFDSGLSFFILLQPAVKLFERDDRRKTALHTSVSVV